MNDFIAWSSMLDYVTFIGIVLGVVQVTKDLPLIKKITTKYWSIIVAFILIVFTKIHFDLFSFNDLILYFVNSIFISLSANGVYDFKQNKYYTPIEMAQNYDEIFETGLDDDGKGEENE